MAILEIRAIWDDEANVWVADSDDVPGLIAEAATLESLMAKLEALIPELMELNCGRLILGFEDMLPVAIAYPKVIPVRLDRAV